MPEAGQLHPPFSPISLAARWILAFACGGAPLAMAQEDAWIDLFSTAPAPSSETHSLRAAAATPSPDHPLDIRFDVLASGLVTTGS